MLMTLVLLAEKKVGRNIYKVFKVVASAVRWNFEKFLSDDRPSWLPQQP